MILGFNICFLAGCFKARILNIFYYCTKCVIVMHTSGLCTPSKFHYVKENLSSINSELGCLNSITFFIYVQESPVGIQRDCAPSAGRAAKPSNTTKFRVKRWAPKTCGYCHAHVSLMSDVRRVVLVWNWRGGWFLLLFFYWILDIMAFL